MGGQPEEVLKEFGSSTPLGRPGQPAEMAPAYVLWLVRNLAISVAKP